MGLTPGEKAKIAVGLEDHIRRLKKYIEDCEGLEIQSKELKQIVKEARAEITDYKELIDKIWNEGSYEPFNGLLSAADAAEIWGIDSSAIRKAIANGRLKNHIDCKKYGKQWILTWDAMERTFGKCKMTKNEFEHLPF